MKLTRYLGLLDTVEVHILSSFYVVRISKLNIYLMTFTKQRLALVLLLVRAGLATWIIMCLKYGKLRHFQRKVSMKRLRFFIH